MIPLKAVFRTVTVSFPHVPLAKTSLMAKSSIADLGFILFLFYSEGMKQIP